MRASTDLRSPRLMGPLALVAAISVVAVAVAADPVVAPTGALAAPGTPGVPADPAVLYAEDFENGTATGAEELESYVGASGATYTADSYWLRAMRCNGFIVEYDVDPTIPVGYCNQPLSSGNWTSLRRKTYALGVVDGADPETNRAVSTNTSGFPDNELPSPDGLIEGGPGQRQFATVGRPVVVVDGPSRFVTASVDAAADACQLSHPLLQFFLVDATGSEIAVSDSPLDPCEDPRSQTVSVDGTTVRAGRFAADRSILVSGGSLGIVVRNAQPQSSGNDGAFDNIRLLDVTPQLDKVFSPATVPAGGTSRLTFTVTNTSELAAKPGWQFTDTLPPGLRVTDAAAVGGTCEVDVTATAGTITAVDGQLSEGETSCTITLPVTATPAVKGPAALTYANCPTNLTDVLGLNLPACARVTFRRGTPLVHTRTSQRRVSPGQPFRDRIHVRGLSSGHAVTATAQLYGPFTSRAAARCEPQFLARSTTVHVTNGWNRTPRVRVTAPGVYTWKVTTRADTATTSATHPCGQAAETTLVAKPAFRAPIIDGGFSGTLLPTDQARRAPDPTISMPSTGLHAPIRSAPIVAGHMVLPGAVGDVAWLRRSAGIGDTIGTTVIGGHVSDRRDRPGAMVDLHQAKPGQRITLARGHHTYRFKVVTTKTFDRDHRLPQRYFTTTGRPRLVLITCTGRVVRPDGRFHYTRYVVVVAHRIRH